MMISYFVITIIFTYAIYTLVKFAKKSKEAGACAHCSIKTSCASNCSIPPQSFSKK